MVTKVREGRAGALYAAVGAEVRTRRELHGMTQEHLADRVGLSRASVANIECGRQAVPLHLLAKTAEALKTTCSDILRIAEATPEASERIPDDLPVRVMAFVQRKLRTAQ